MPLRLEIDYAPGILVGAVIGRSPKPLKYGISYKEIKNGEEGQIYLAADLKLDARQSFVLTSLLVSLNNDTREVINCAIEAAFLAGIMYGNVVSAS